MTKPQGFYPGWTGRTRCNCECGVYATAGRDGNGKGEWPIHGWYIHPNFGKVLALRRADGTGHYNKDFDFILEPSPPRGVWVNEYPNGLFTVYTSRAAADHEATPYRIGHARKAILTFVEDEG